MPYLKSLSLIVTYHKTQKKFIKWIKRLQCCIYISIKVFKGLGTLFYVLLGNEILKNKPCTITIPHNYCRVSASWFSFYSLTNLTKCHKIKIRYQYFSRFQSTTRFHFPLFPFALSCSFKCLCYFPQRQLSNSMEFISMP